MTDYNQRGSNFEREVERLLMLKGYSICRNQLINGTQVDLVAHKSDGLNDATLVVECTDRDTTIGVELVKQKASLLLSLRDNVSLYRMLIITRKGFTAEARAFGDSQPNILLLTLTELESKLIDFTPYVHWYLDSYERSIGIFQEGRLYNDYVELTGKDPDDTILPSLTEEMKKWLASTGNNLLFLLGKYGSGKISFCRHLVYTLLRAKFVDNAKGVFGWLPGIEGKPGNRQSRLLIFEALATSNSPTPLRAAHQKSIVSY